MKSSILKRTAKVFLSSVPILSRSMSFNRSRAVSLFAPSPAPVGAAKGREEENPFKGRENIRDDLIHLSNLLRITPKPSPLELRRCLKALRDRTVQLNSQHVFTSARKALRRGNRRSSFSSLREQQTDLRGEELTVSERESAALLYVLLASLCFVEDTPPDLHEPPLHQHIDALLRHAGSGDRRQFHDAVESVVQQILLFTPLQAPVVIEMEDTNSVPRRAVADDTIFFSPDASPKRTKAQLNLGGKRVASSSSGTPSSAASPGLPPRRDVHDAEGGVGSQLDHCADFLVMHAGRPAVDPVAWKKWMSTIEQCYLEWAKEHSAAETDASAAVTSRERRASSGSHTGVSTSSEAQKAVQLLPPLPLQLRQYWQNPTNLYGQFCTFLLVVFFTKGVNAENYDARLLKLTQYFHYHFDVHHCVTPIPLLDVTPGRRQRARTPSGPGEEGDEGPTFSLYRSVPRHGTPPQCSDGTRTPDSQTQNPASLECTQAPRHGSNSTARVPAKESGKASPRTASVLYPPPHHLSDWGGMAQACLHPAVAPPRKSSVFHFQYARNSARRHSSASEASHGTRHTVSSRIHKKNPICSRY